MNHPAKDKVSPSENLSKGGRSGMLEGANKMSLTPSRVKYNGGPVLGSTTIDIHGGHLSDQAYHCSASSVESLPSASGSSKSKFVFYPVPHAILTFPLTYWIGTQALVRGSPNSSMSADDRVNPVCRARAVVDHVANPFDKDALSFKVIINCPFSVILN